MHTSGLHLGEISEESLNKVVPNGRVWIFLRLLTFVANLHSGISSPEGYLQHLLPKGFTVLLNIPTLASPSGIPGTSLPLASVPPSLGALRPFVLCPRQPPILAVCVSLSQDLPTPARLFLRLWVSPRSPDTASASLALELQDHKVVTSPCLCLHPLHSRLGISVSS